MALLLDTNVLIWMYTGDARMSPLAIERISSGRDKIYVSVISAWEFEQKRRKRPEQLDVGFEKILGNLPYEGLNFEYHLYRFAETLPLIHKDPFDRMLIAQALHHDLEFIASDKVIHQYPVRIFW